MQRYCLQLAFVTELKRRLVWVSYCHGTEAEVGMGFLRGWQLHRPKQPHMTLGVDSWHRLGIGCFMIVIIIV